MAGIVLATHWGPGVEPDSVAYFSAAKNIAAGHGVILTRTPDEFRPMTHWPPVYSMVLASGLMLGLEITDSARLLSILLIFANVALIGFIIRWQVTNDIPALIGALLVSSCFAVIWIHAYALSEGLFTFFCLAALASLDRYINKPSPWLLALGALAVSAAVLTRYAGAAMFLAGIVALLLPRPANMKRRIMDTLFFSSLAALPILAWLIRNSIVGESAVGRELALKPFRFYHLESFARGLSLWLFPADVNRYLRLSLTILVLLTIVVGLVYIYRHARRQSDLSLIRTITILCVSFLIGYWALYAFTILIFDNFVSLSWRTQMPAFAITVVLITILFHDLLRSNGISPKLSRILVGASCGLILLAAANTSIFVARSYKEGLGFSSKYWKTSELIQLIKKSPRDAVIYANSTAAIQFYTNRRTRLVRAHKFTGLSDRDYLTRLRAEVAELKRSNRPFYYFTSRDIERYVTEQHLAKVLGLEPVSTHPDGTVYRAR